jgi:hypothetical protein
MKKIISGPYTFEIDFDTTCIGNCLKNNITTIKINFQIISLEIKIEDLLFINPKELIKLKESNHTINLDSQNKIVVENNMILFIINHITFIDSILISIPLEHFLEVIDYLIEKIKYWENITISNNIIFSI